MNPKHGIHERRSIRLHDYDYSLAGAYFVTICTQNRECLFGEVSAGQMRLNDAGWMVAQWYAEMEHKFIDIECDAFVCMPNHVHFIAVNLGAYRCVRPESTTRRKTGAHIGTPLQRVVQWFKTMSTNEYIRGVKQDNWPPFSGKLWQRNYWEHVVRNEPALNRLREYIHNNPSRWEADMYFVGADLCVRPGAPGGNNGRTSG